MGKKTTHVCIFPAWAEQRGFYTANAARLDGNRGANNLLRLAVEGKLCLCLFRPGYTKKKGLFWVEIWGALLMPYTINRQ
ncbi:hypothetical protein DPMN_156739 [Dreissena polymorpha]|uniref:Uncharacterized protein n=1 Tax=Dreissena polymorpha TaxID=45954 RepID=A0A9D4FRS0_DREPO|nr:hypothetical protein DPMN_156739 [Dreissena polymorpha]